MDADAFVVDVEGAVVRDGEYVHSRTFRADDGTDCIDVLTMCEYEGGEARRRAPAEVAAVHWLPPEEVRSRQDAPDFLVRDVERVEARRDGSDA